MKNQEGNVVEQLMVTRIFDAPRELVWKAWTDPNYVKQWMGPQGFTTPVYNIDFRVGGKFHYCMKSPDGKEFWGGGEYFEIDPLVKIVYSQYFTDAQGNKVDAATLGIEHKADANVHDRVTFEDLGNGKTKITIYGNETMEDAKSSGQYEGWTQCLDKMADFLADLPK